MFQRIILLAVFLSFFHGFCKAQSEEEIENIRRIYTNALESDFAYEGLRYLSVEIGPRLCGSESSLKAIDFGESFFKKAGVDVVRRHKITGPNWESGNIAEAIVYFGKTQQKELSICPLGFSIPTPEKGIRADVIEVPDFDSLHKLGRDNVEGKIVFLNKPFNNSCINPFEAYGQVARNRTQGAVESAKLGAKAVIVRSIASEIDDFPHTGIQRYNDEVEKIPTSSISTLDAEFLSQALKANPDLQLKLTMNCKHFPDTVSYNLIGEIKGSEKPDQVIVVSGHIDSWFNDPGAHDDGAGCMQAIDVIRIFKELGIKPKHTIRAIWYMDEECSQSGGKQYARKVIDENEIHIAALESDAGGTTPVGFSCTDSASVEKIKAWIPALQDFGVNYIRQGWGGVDIGPLKEGGVPLIGLNVDPQRYFEYHHCANDTFDKINRRELNLGSAAMAALIYLIDLYEL